MTRNVTEYGEKVAKVEQDFEGITQTVESMEEFAREMSSINQLHLTETAELENLVLTFKAYGDTNKWISLAPSSSLAPSVSLAPFGSSITIICDTQPRDNPSLNKKEHKIMIDKKLRNLGDIKDELNILVLRDEPLLYGSFSGGERGRLEYAMILAQQTMINQSNPYGGLHFLFTDEVAEGIDSLGLKNIVKSLENFTIPILLTTHVTNQFVGAKILKVIKENNIL